MLTSYWGALHTVLDFGKVMQRGYTEYRGEMFKMPLMGRWLVVVTTHQLISEVSRAPEKELSMNEATAEVSYNLSSNLGTADMVAI